MDKANFLTPLCTCACRRMCLHRATFFRPTWPGRKAIADYFSITMATTGDWVDVRDPNVIAETELLQAAASIEAAATKLAELKPPPKVVCAF